MSNSRIVYPATISGYFRDPAAAEAAAAELSRLDFGPIDPHFEPVTVFRRYVDTEEEPAKPASLLSRLFGRRRTQEATRLRNDAVVTVRGEPALLASRAEPLLRKYGADPIKHYSGWDPQARQPRRAGVPAQSPARWDATEFNSELIASNEPDFRQPREDEA